MVPKVAIFHWHSIRYRGWDYSSEGSYFLTMVTLHRVNLFGTIADGIMKMNEFGRIVQEEWEKSAEIRDEIELDMDEFVVMPNHIHGIIHIVESLVPYHKAVRT